jgi:hypothetical protein
MSYDKPFSPAASMLLTVRICPERGAVLRRRPLGQPDRIYRNAAVACLLFFTSPDFVHASHYPKASLPVTYPAQACVVIRSNSGCGCPVLLEVIVLNPCRSQIWYSSIFATADGAFIPLQRQFITRIDGCKCALSKGAFHQVKYLKRRIHCEV